MRYIQSTSYFTLKLLLLGMGMLVMCHTAAGAAEAERPSDNLEKAMELPEMRDPAAAAPISAPAGSESGMGAMNPGMMRHGAMPGMQGGAMPGMQHGAMHGTQGGAMPGMRGGMHSMMSSPTGETARYNDRTYLSAMIAHHEAAITMSNDVLKNGTDAQVKEWAESILKTQQKEIDAMRRRLQTMGGEDVPATQAMSMSMHGMMAAPAGMDADRAFITGMLQHHKAAVEMASQAIVNSANTDVVALSKEIIDEQATEIEAFQKWLWQHSPMGNDPNLMDPALTDPAFVSPARAQ